LFGVLSVGLFYFLLPTVKVMLCTLPSCTPTASPYKISKQPPLRHNENYARVKIKTRLWLGQHSFPFSQNTALLLSWNWRHCSDSRYSHITTLLSRRPFMLRLVCLLSFPYLVCSLDALLSGSGMVMGGLSGPISWHCVYVFLGTGLPRLMPWGSGRQIMPASGQADARVKMFRTLGSFTHSLWQN
jgi:hypothetical protein